MPTAIFDSDYAKADMAILSCTGSLRIMIANAIAEERERCAQIADKYGAFMTAREIRALALKDEL